MKQKKIIIVVPALLPNQMNSAIRARRRGHPVLKSGVIMLNTE